MYPRTRDVVQWLEHLLGLHLLDIHSIFNTVNTKGQAGCTRTITRGGQRTEPPGGHGSEE